MFLLIHESMNAHLSAQPTTRYITEPLSAEGLEEQNRQLKGTGGVSQQNRTLGFRPAFLNLETGRVYLSRFADGRPAPMHLLEGLPAALAAKHSASGRIMAAKASVLAGFLRNGHFYTRDQAAWQVER